MSMARQALRRRQAANKMIFVITDGQPTAHTQPGPDGREMLHLWYPPSETTAEVTLREALRCQQEGLRICSFALADDYWEMGWVGFIDRLTRLVRGAAFYCTGDDLGSIMLESYLSGRRRRKFSG
jgi:uncharacterized protein with von Willebrand factor type A (vWA) domain